MSEMLLYCGIMLIGVLIGGFSQILLKKASNKNYDKWYRSYLNAYVITAYTIFILSTICTVIAYRVVPLSMSPLWTSLSYIAVTAMSYVLLHERPNSRKLKGILIVTAGIIIFCI